MANSTTNYNLIKPLKTEKADIDVINGNMDIIDLSLKSIADGLSSISTQFKFIFIGTLEEYNTAYSNGNIVNGSLIIITDDEI